jgi:hypothetical protein
MACFLVTIQLVLSQQLKPETFMVVQDEGSIDDMGAALE